MPELDEPVHVSEYDASWPEMFAAERARLIEALGANSENLQHIGGTAVPGLVAKPIIDLMLGLTAYPPSQAMRHAIGGLGYEALGEAGVPGRLYFRLRALQLSANLHVVAQGGTHWVQNIALRDYLRANPAARERYARAKLAAVASGAQALLAYSSAKAAVVNALLQEACAHQNGS